MSTAEFGSQWYESQLGLVDAQIAKLAAILDLRILDPGVIERVIAGDDTVCGRASDKAFRNLRALIRMHYVLTDDSLTAIGPEQCARILDRMRERFGARYDLGGKR